MEGSAHVSKQISSQRSRSHAAGVPLQASDCLKLSESPLSFVVHVRDEFDDFTEFLLLGRVVGVEFPEFVEPAELKELLGEEETRDEEGLRAEE